MTQTSDPKRETCSTTASSLKTIKLVSRDYSSSIPLTTCISDTTGAEEDIHLLGKENTPLGVG